MPASSINQPRHHSRLIGLLILILTAGAIAGLLRSCSGPAARATPNVQRPSARAALAGSMTSSPVEVTGVEQRLITDVSNLQGAYGVAVIDLATGASYGVNGNRIFRAASVNKMPIIVTLYERATLGRLTLDQTLALSESDIQHYGTGIIQNSDAPRVYTLSQLGALMIQVSDNTAAYVLERFLGQQTIQQNAKHWRLDHTSMADNTTTPADAASLMASLYADRLVPSDATEAILSLLQSSVFGDRLGAGLPAGVTLAHKVGTDLGVYNDAGVVMFAQRPYAIAVLSEDADEPEASAAFARVSKDVYDFQVSLGPVRPR